jgi:hypothetical protein
MGKKFIIVSYKTTTGGEYFKIVKVGSHWEKILGITLYENQPAKKLSKFGREAQ